MWTCEVCGREDNDAERDECFECGFTRGSKPPPRAVSKLSPRLLLGVVALGVLGFVGYRVWDNLDRIGIVARPTLEVTGHRWQRTVGITQHGSWDEETWCSRMKTAFPGAVDISREVRASGAERVQVGERCKPGEPLEPCIPTYEDRPVTDDWCRFSWTGDKEVRTVEAAGEDLAPRWPEVDLGAEEAEGARRASYVVVLAGEGQTATCTVDEAAWQRMALDSRWVAEQSLRHGTLDCASLQPAR